jgi:benzoate transport
MSFRDVIDRSPMTKFQIMVVGLCLFMNVIEGFDILVMSFAASGVATEWHLSASQIGVLLSSGLIGMALGSAFVAPLGDRLGRRPLTLLALSVAGIGMLLSGLTAGFGQLAVCRLVTGVGVGGVMASLPVIISEYSNRRGRGTSTAFFALGLPLGGVLGGSVAALVTSGYGWRATFALGAVLTLATGAAMAFLLPESLDYLAVRRPTDALAKINRLLARMRIPALEELPRPKEAELAGAGAAILTGRGSLRTLLLWVAFFGLFSALYFATSWTPRLLEQNGVSAQQGISGGILLNVGGVVGTLIVAGLALRLSSMTLGVLTLAAAGVAFVVMSSSLGSLTATMLVALLVGLLLNANGAVLYALAPTLYPVGVRTTGVGWAIAVGRIGGILAPLIAGVLVDGGWTAVNLFAVFAVPLLLAAVAVLVIARLGSGAAAATSHPPKSTVAQNGQPAPAAGARQSRGE